MGNDGRIAKRRRLLLQRQMGAAPKPQFPCWVERSRRHAECGIIPRRRVRRVKNVAKRGEYLYFGMNPFHVLEFTNGMRGQPRSV